MPKSVQSVDQLLKPTTRFLRSVYLERDFHDENALTGYILTKHSREALERIVSGLKPSSGHRAWRITGNYGAGKSSFALLLAHWLAGNSNVLASEVQSQIPYSRILHKKPNVMPVLVTGSREPLSTAIARGIIAAASPLCTTGRPPSFLTIMKKLVEKQSDDESNDEKVISAIESATKYIVEKGISSGLLLIIDEMGKFLEYAALHPEYQDIYLLQRLAETASRSLDTPICIIALLHQGFQEYAHSLTEPAQREWEKVAARFEEILFDQPLEQLTTLIGAALNVRLDKLPKRLKQGATSAMQRIIDVGWFGSKATCSGLVDHAPSVFPLHASVLPVLSRFFRRFGQNERSLFSFLMSNEPFGLQAFTERSLQGDPFFRLHHFYDYVRCNFGHRLMLRSYRTHWNMIDSMIQTFVPSSPGELEILKTVGMLNLLDADDLRATEDVVLHSIASSGDDENRLQTVASLTRLRSSKGALYQRGRAGDLSLWPYTSVNLELAYERAMKAISSSMNVSTRVGRYLETRPIVARRHYIETGNLRYFDVKYITISELHAGFQERDRHSDGLIVLPLCESEEEYQQAIAFAMSEEVSELEEVFIAVPPPLHNLAGVIAEVERWEWITRNTPEIANDRYAFEEVSRQRRAAVSTLESRIGSFLGLHQFSSETSLECYHKGLLLSVKSGRDMLEYISNICDDLYDQAPVIKNELVNRHFLSSAATAARMRLIERILEYPSEPLLGMDPDKKPPEMSMYLSLLKGANLHRNYGDYWGIGPPEQENDPCSIRPTWDAIETLLLHQPDARISLPELASALRHPPYGVRDGIIPVLLAVYFVANRDRVAFYEDGSFCPTMHREEFMRLIRAPETFEIQYCHSDGVRTEVLQKAYQLISDGSLITDNPAVLDVVRPICIFVAELPEYSRRTRKLSDISIAVRNAILNAKDPTRLLFYELPKACECLPIRKSEHESYLRPNTIQFIDRLRTSFSELRMAYTQLLDRIGQQLSIVLDLPNNPLELRSQIMNRTALIQQDLVEAQLKAFSTRLLDTNLTSMKWLESIGSYLARRPPSKWTDTDEGHFQHELAIIGTRFSRVESMLFIDRNIAFDPSRMRIIMTRSDGRERDRIVRIDHEQEAAVAEIETSLMELLSSKGNICLTAMTRVLWKTITEIDEDNEQEDTTHS